MGELVGLVVAIVFLLILLWVATLTLRIGANWAGIAKAKNTIGRAAIALFCSWLVIGFFGGSGSFIPGIGNVLGVIVGIAINGLIVGAVYGVKFGKGVQIYLLSIVAQIVVIIVAVLVLGLLGVSLA
ncbi:MAG: hypothetical protein AAFX93_11235 [Verrucomicrobiota bacterium]